MIFQLDFAMNYGHEHLEEMVNEWFSRAQTTILPAIVWFRRGVDVVQQHILYISDDTRHSNLFVQKV
jgi:hypothetical protein